jgi:AcrR family transcriptional regulator
MVQVLSPTKFDQIVVAAGRVFALLGYRRALVTDVAAEAGVAIGTVYRYAETKEELFELALRRGFGVETATLWAAARSGRGFEESVLQFVRERLAEAGRLPLLEEANAGDPPRDVTTWLTDTIWRSGSSTGPPTTGPS